MRVRDSDVKPVEVVADVRTLGYVSRPYPSRSRGGPRRQNQNSVTVLVNDNRPFPQLRAVHQPQLGRTGGLVVPDDVTIPVAIHIVRTDDGPWQTDENRLAILVDDRCPVHHFLAVHEPDLRFIGLGVVPYK